MSRISLVEAYDNRDVIGQLVRLREDMNELLNILKDLDPNGDLTNVVTKTGDQTIDGVKTFIGKIVADCDIIQLGGNYETHAEQVYSKNDYIIMRDEAVNALAPGTYSGLQIKKYNGSDDLRIAADQYGVARLGDIGDEKPLMVRDETADMTSGNILTWDGVNQKAITSAKGVGDLVAGSGNIGSDSKPVKIVNGEAVPVTGDLVHGVNVTKILTGVCSPGVNSVTFSEPFDHIPQVYLSVYNSNTGLVWSMAITGVSKTGFTFETKYSALSGNVPTGYAAFYQDVMWMAIGN